VTCTDDHPNVTYLTQAAGCDEMAISDDGTKPFKHFPQIQLIQTARALDYRTVPVQKLIRYRVSPADPSNQKVTSPMRWQGAEKTTQK